MKNFTNSKSTSVDDCQLVDLPQIKSWHGSITPLYPEETIPFSVERVYFLYDIPGGASRGGHAHRNLQQLLVAAMGAFDVVLRDGVNERTVRLERPYSGLVLPNMIWRELINFSSGGICLVLASLHYDEKEYIRDYDEFLSLKVPENPQNS